MAKEKKARTSRKKRRRAAEAGSSGSEDGAALARIAAGESSDARRASHCRWRCYARRFS